MDTYTLIQDKEALEAKISRLRDLAKRSKGRNKEAVLGHIRTLQLCLEDLK